MLQTLRDKTSGWIATVVLGLLTIPFAFVGIEQYMGQRNDNAVVRIDAPPTWWKSAPSWWPVSVFWQHETISADEFRKQFELMRQQQRQQMGEAFDPRAFESMDSKRAVLESLIDQKVQGIALQDAGIVISDLQVRKAIQSVPAFQVDGKFDATRYQLVLASQSPAQSPRQFEDGVRDQLRQSLLSRGVGTTGFVTDGELNRLMKLLGERRSVSLVMLPSPAPDTAAVSAAEIKAWYDAHPAQFRAPQTVSIEYVELDAAAMPVPPAADEAALRARYEQEKSRYAAAEERLASHILVRVPEGGDAAAQKAAQDKAAKLAADAKAPGADFAALARANSDDAGSKATGGDLGWVGKGMMVGPFENALFAMKTGEVSGPIKSDFGWHVIQLRELKSGTQQPFEQVREQLAREQAEADRDRAFNDVSTKLIDLVYKNPSSLAPAARAMNLPVQKLGPFARDASEGILATPAVKRAVFSESLIEDGTVSDPIEIAPNHSVLVRVVASNPERTLPLAEVQGKVIASVRADRSAKAAMKDADALVARLRAGEALATIAAEKQAEPPQEIPDLPRGAPMPEPVVSEAAFAVAPPAEGKNSPGKAVLADGRIVLFTVNKVIPTDPATVPPEQSAGLRQGIAQMRGDEDAKALLSALRKRYRIKVVESNL